MEKKLEDKYYYVAILIIVPMVLAFLFASDKSIGVDERDVMPVVQPFEHIEETASTDWYYFKKAQLSPDGGTLLFMTVHQFVEVYADDYLIYSLKPGNPVFGNTTGTRWNFVEVPEDASSIQVRLEGAYRQTYHQETRFFYGKSVTLYINLIKQSAGSMLLSILNALIGVFMILYWLLMNNRAPISKALVYLGMFAVCLGLWSLGETDAAVLLIKNRVACSYSAFILLMAMIMPIASFIRELLKTDERWGWRAIFIYSAVNMFTLMAMQTFQIADLRETVVFTHVGFLLLAGYSVYSVVIAIRKNGFTRELKNHTAGLAVLVTTVVVSLMQYYEKGFEADRFGRVGFFLYIIFMCVATSQSALKQLEEGKKAVYYKELANTDILTGLNNRNAFITDMENREPKKGNAIVVFDLNELKKTNDSFGHLAGDKYIVDSARLISKIFGPYGKCYRIGGDEFCAIADNISEEELKTIAERLEMRQEQYNAASSQILMKIACGYAMYESELDDSLENTRSRADMGMYDNKICIKRSKEGQKAYMKK